ncbi:hypothetical protein SAMN05444287_2101 [Octadecabacter temperatus]|uniref:Uncharacterized protein n=1 Tax=Octadecabacter temperatus TaxID=1458307 RepID=A0A0K0Y7W3_9RHOB|nr:hypothetical protein [Octadecabacter temperatus]AKS46976.1 hypothetical protein OSB_24410 [Octadecabacter temperatus]SIO24588.1 hypothetical protein SAMN05444287_2101 [Octadecabacter temperatus]
MTNEPWGEDLLNVKARGETFTNLIKSIDDSKIISIEAGFERGKTQLGLPLQRMTALSPKYSFSASPRMSAVRKPIDTFMT